ncbi:hypothetical protein Y032_0550g3300 [Ancylostoma ceylanicum]|uniref:Uncharacterized protein n=1 Tax=Ancylostoma ceylanicum TaxID=53326 RepID=A0A016WQI7_9BILA|nr:hypothetical protein Y032_0550g3300 [Ancylostoma ceylanicum]
MSVSHRPLLYDNVPNCKENRIKNACLSLILTISVLEQLSEDAGPLLQAERAARSARPKTFYRLRSFYQSLGHSW